MMDAGYPKPVIKGFGGLSGKIIAALSVAKHKNRPESVFFFKRGWFMFRIFETLDTVHQLMETGLLSTRNNEQLTMVCLVTRTSLRSLRFHSASSPILGLISFLRKTIISPAFVVVANHNLPQNQYYA